MKKSKVTSKCNLRNTDYVTVRDNKRLISFFEDDYVSITVLLNCTTNLKEYVITRKLSSSVVVVQDSLFID